MEVESGFSFKLVAEKALLDDLVNVESENNDPCLDPIQQIFVERGFQCRFSSQGR